MIQITLGIPIKEDRFGKPGEVMRDVKPAINIMHEYAVDHYGGTDNFKLFELKVESGDPVEARMRIVDNIVGSHVLFLDADTRPDQDMLVKLLEADKDFVAAPMVQQGYPHFMNVFTKIKGDNFAPWQLGIDFTHEDVLQGRIKECDAHGFGAVLLRREVFDEIRPPYFIRIPHPVFPIMNYGHDISFCIRAKEAGIKIFTHFGAVARHAFVSYLSLDAHLNAYVEDENIAVGMTSARESEEAYVA